VDPPDVPGWRNDELLPHPLDVSGNINHFHCFQLLQVRSNLC
jgi:hypothetical protein